VKESQPAAGQMPANGLKGWHVLAMLLAFFGVVFSVNGAFLYSALKTHTGVVTAEPFVKGLHYNERIAQGERQARLGWSTRLDVSLTGEIVLTVVGDDKRGLDHLTASGEIGRPSTNRLDRQLAFASAGNGRYVANTGALEPGAWLVTARLQSRDYGAEPVYRLRKRIWLKP
jgi:nitrogen fixation protein FixH